MYLIDVVLAYLANSLFAFGADALFIDDVLFEVTTVMTDEFIAASALVDAVELEGVELEMAKLALLCLVAFIDAFVYELF